MYRYDPSSSVTIEKLQEAPADRRCSSGHVAPEQFRRGGPEDEPSPTLFFRVTGQGVSGIYCEPCLIVSQHVARLKKEGKI